MDQAGRRGAVKLMLVARASRHVAIQRSVQGRIRTCRSFQNTFSGRVRVVSTSQRYRLRNPASGREIVIEAEPDEIYLDRETGEPLEGVGKLLPLVPSSSRLPWAVENLRFCPWCDQLAQKDLNDCPTCTRRMGPLTSRTAG